MNYGIILLLLSSISCDEHIPRQVETPPNNPEGALESKTKEIITESDVHSVESGLNNQIGDLSHQLSLENQDIGELPNAGASIFSDSSYVTFTVLVGKRSFDCYFYKAKKSFDVDFQVLKGGDFDIALSIFDVNSKMVASHKAAGDGSLKIVVPVDMLDTHYSICLDNKETSWHVKKVFLMLDVEGPNGINHPDLQYDGTGHSVNPMIKLDMMSIALTNVYHSLMTVEQLQERRRIVEAIDRSVMEGNYEYVTMWAMTQIFLMVVVSAIQVVMIRSLFDSRGGLGAKIWEKLNDLTGRRL